MLREANAAPGSRALSPPTDCCGLTVLLPLPRTPLLFTQREVPDVILPGSVASDSVGRISPELMASALEQMDLGPDAPKVSAVQVSDCKRPAALPTVCVLFLNRSVGVCGACSGGACPGRFRWLEAPPHPRGRPPIK